MVEEGLDGAIVCGPVMACLIESFDDTIRNITNAIGRGIMNVIGMVVTLVSAFPIGIN